MNGSITCPHISKTSQCTINILNVKIMQGNIARTWKWSHLHTKGDNVNKIIVIMIQGGCPMLMY